MIEEEVFGELTKEQFDRFLNEFSSSYGEPKVKKRLAISFWDPKFKDSDTRIRVTNGKAQIVQKVGAWENTETIKLEEREIEIPSDAKTFMEYYLVLLNVAERSVGPMLIRTENYVFQTPTVEIKLSKQFGTTEHYTFEVELTDDSKKLTDELVSIGLDKHVIVTNVEFWAEWNKKMTVYTDKIDIQDLRKIVDTYF